MLYTFNLFNKLIGRFCIHILDDYHRIGTLIKIIHKNVLPLHSFYLARKVIQNIIVNSCIKVSDCRWNEKQETQNKNWNSEFYNYFSKLFHNSPHFYVCDAFFIFISFTFSLIITDKYDDINVKIPF